MRVRDDGMIRDIWLPPMRAYVDGRGLPRAAADVILREVFTSVPDRAPIDWLDADAVYAAVERSPIVYWWPWSEQWL